MDARLGEQSDVVQNMFLKRTPSAARRSMFGVFKCGCPAQPSASQRISSQRMKRTFGLSAALSALPVASAHRRMRKRFFMGDEACHERRLGRECRCCAARDWRACKVERKGRWVQSENAARREIDFTA